MLEKSMKEHVIAAVSSLLLASTPTETAREHRVFDLGTAFNVTVPRNFKRDMQVAFKQKAELATLMFLLMVYLVSLGR